MEELDYKEIANSLERENIALRMFIIKRSLNEDTFFTKVKDFFNTPENMGILYGVGLIFSFILLPFLSFLREVQK